ncbi:type VII secretion protein EccCa [Actinosynnema sp. CS-041913]|uniref:type VII secretion protein EccCa n=1 Tax=Actinosynnema sp. CS-041913 TaxID=3239917 RepID=UPI003D929412
MNVRLVHRPTRAVRPRRADEPLDVAAPPILPDGKGLSGIFTLLPIAGSTASLTLMMFFRGSGFAALGAVMMVVVLAATGVMYLSQRGQAVRNRKQHRERYLDHLERLREELAGHERAARDAAALLDPPPDALADLVRDRGRRWERRRRDRDFLVVRVGAGPAPGRPLRLSDDGTPTNPTDPFLLAEARMLLRRFGTVAGQPLPVRLDLAGDVSVVGDRPRVLAALRVLLCQVAALHAPEDVAIAACHPADAIGDWSWLRWLPHLADPALTDETGPLRRIAPDPTALCALLADDLAARATRAAQARRFDGTANPAANGQRLLVVCDCHGHDAKPLPLPDKAASAAELGITVVHLVAERTAEPDEVSARVTVAPGGAVTVEDLRADTTSEGELDRFPQASAEGLARSLAPLRLHPESYDDGTGTAPADFAELVDVDWAPRSDRDFLRVPIGVDTAGRPVLLDLKESAQLGMGPHGLCVGATGSGKSELLRTLLLSLVATHPPTQLNLVMIDYKGGATFAPLARLPHVTGLITNLIDDDGLVGRVRASLAGEVQRRQQVLADAGKVSDIATYRLLREADPDLPELPHLLVVIDEFGELLTAEPEMIELFLTIGRIGRSIGVHLLLASQRLEAGKIRQLDTHLSYRLGLRTLSETESRTVLETPDAFHLPPLPGFGYLKVDVSVYTQFKTAYVSGPLRTGSDEPAAVTGPRVRPALPYSARPALPLADADHTATERTTGPTLLSAVVDRLADAAPAGRRLWLPPLPDAISLDRAAGGLRASDAGLRLGGSPTSSAAGSPLGGSAASSAAGPPLGTRPTGLAVPVGLLDDPAKQWQGTWWLDLASSGGHVAVLGGPQSGKTTFLRTLVLGLATTHTPAEVAVYGVDLVGTGLRALERLPNVGGIAGRDDAERVRRTLEELTAMLELRDEVFRRHRLDDMAELRAAHAAGRVPELAAADVVLVLDGYGHLSGDFERHESLVHAMLARGGAHGLHVVTTARRFGEIRMAQQVAFGTRVELRLAEPAESGIDGKLARAVPTGRPGRALTADKLYGQVALPRVDGGTDLSGTGEALAQAVRAVRSSWIGPTAPPVRVLPGLLPADALPGVASGIPFGVEESTLGPAVLDLFGDDRHLLVLGDGGCGKSNLLRVLASRLVASHTEDELVFAVFDPRRTLRSVVPESHLGGYAPNAALAAQLAGSVGEELANRVESGGSGPRVVLLMDDYDVLTAGGARPLSPLAPYVSADVGLHVVMTRRVLGASRGIYEPFTTVVRESGCTGLLMSGDRSEGQVFPGVRPSVLPVGRGLLIRQGDPARTVQTAYAGEAVEGAA